MKPANLAEREQAKESLEFSLTEAKAGRSSFFIIEGGTGTGKTELVRFASDLATCAHIPHLWATNSTINAASPFGVIQQLLLHPFADDRIDPETREELTSVGNAIASVTQQDPDCSQLPSSLSERLRQALTKAAHVSPFLVTVEDIHNADPASLKLLQRIICEWRGGGLVVLLSQSHHFPPVDPLFHVETIRSPLYRRIRTRPLSKTGVRQTLVDHLGGTITDRLATEYTEATGGNPLLLRCLMEDAKNSGEGTDVLLPGREYRQSVLACLRTCDPHTARVAEAAAVLSTSARLRSAAPLLLRYMFTEGQSSTEMALSALQEMGILDDRCHFRLPTAMNTVLDGVAPERYRGLRIRAVHTMHLSGSNKEHPSVVNRILGQSTTGSWTVELLKDAATEDLAQNETSSAIAHLELALESCDDRAEKSRITMALTQARWRIDPLTATQHLNCLIDSFYEGILRVTDSVDLMQALIWHGRGREVLEMIQHLLRTGEYRRRLEFLSKCRPLVNLQPSLQEVLEAEGADDTSLYEAVSTSRLSRADSVLNSLFTGDSPEEAVNTAEQFLRTSHLADSTFMTTEAALLVLVYSGSLTNARHACEVLLAQAADRDVPLWNAVFSAHRGEIALRQGDPVTAESLAREALNTLPSRSWGVAIGAPLGTLLLSTTRLGRLDEATSLLQYEPPEAMYSSRYGLGYLIARGRYHLASGSASVALTDFKHCERLIRQWGLDFPGFHDWRSATAEALIDLGRPDEARTYLDEQRELLCQKDHRGRAEALLLWSRTEPVQNRPALLNQAIDLFRVANDDLALGRALLELGHTFESLGEVKKAQRLKERADRLVAKVRSNAAPVDHPGPHEPVPAECLTKSERRVAELAAQGQSNREISRNLFITISTVEQHLTQVYRKLNVKNRLALPSVIAETAPVHTSAVPNPSIDPRRVLNSSAVNAG